MNLKERCEAMSERIEEHYSIMFAGTGERDLIKMLEAFAREIRNETLEEIASDSEDWDVHWAIWDAIRALKTDALAATGQSSINKEGETK